MIPFFIVYRKQAIPYYAALLSHIFIDDLFNFGGNQLFWPLSDGWIGGMEIGITRTIAELALFFVTLPMMYKLGDLQTLLKPHNKNWALIFPLVTILGPFLALGLGTDMAMPTLLVIPSLFYVGLFTLFDDC